MTSAGLKELPSAPDVFARRARSFHWASRILTPESVEAVTRLYAFCRYLDDLADDLPSNEARPRLLELREQFHSAGHPDAVVLDFRRLAEEFQLDLRGAQYLFDGLLRDVEGLRFETADDVVRYGYDVAGVVGLWMAQLLGARSERALPFAIDLGIAMQMTNIARDVAEDAARARIYLPQRWLGAGISATTVLAPSVSEGAAIHAARLRLLELAEVYYRSANRGMRFLPLRARLCILTAARVYRGIGCGIRTAGPRALSTRAVVGTGGKLALTVGAALSMPWVSVPGGGHDPLLHTPLGERPGADARAGR